MSPHVPSSCFAKQRNADTSDAVHPPTIITITNLLPPAALDPTHKKTQLMNNRDTRIKTYVYSPVSVVILQKTTLSHLEVWFPSADSPPSEQKLEHSRYKCAKYSGEKNRWGRKCRSHLQVNSIVFSWLRSLTLRWAWRGGAWKGSWGWRCVGIRRSETFPASSSPQTWMRSWRSESNCFCRKPPCTQLYKHKRRNTDSNGSWRAIFSSMWRRAWAGSKPDNKSTNQQNFNKSAYSVPPPNPCGIHRWIQILKYARSSSCLW